MGWTGEINYEGYTPKQFWINKYIPRLESYGKFKLIEQNSRGREFYAAIKNLESGKTFGLVVLIEKNGDEIIYKEMDESTHPFYYNATKKLISKLSPTDSEYAIDWRKTCLSKFKS